MSLEYSLLEKEALENLDTEIEKVKELIGKYSELHIYMSMDEMWEREIIVDALNVKLDSLRKTKFWKMI